MSKPITHLGIKKETTETVYAGDGYRFPSDEEHEEFTRAGEAPIGWEWRNSTGKWVIEGFEWSYPDTGRHNFRTKIKDEPKPIAYECSAMMLNAYIFNTLGCNRDDTVRIEVVKP